MKRNETGLYFSHKEDLEYESDPTMVLYPLGISTHKGFPDSDPPLSGGSHEGLVTVIESRGVI